MVGNPDLNADPCNAFTCALDCSDSCGWDRWDIPIISGPIPALAPFSLHITL